MSKQPRPLHQTARGAWVAVDKPIDENADPLTTGYVIGVLRTFERADLLSAVAIHERDLFLARYWKAGLLWLYENLLQHDGWWPYRDEKRTYCYTSDILLAVPDLWMEDPDYEKAHENLVTRLFDIWRKNGIGIPSGPCSDVPNLEATVQYVAAIWRCRVRYPDLSAETQKMFIANLESILDDGDSDAAGWALTISHLVRDLNATRATECELSFLRQMARRIEALHSEGDTLSLECAMLPCWTSNIVRNKILSVTVNPT